VREAQGLTNTGRVRANNEDNLKVAPEVGLYIVADGMGGAQAGEMASQLAIEAATAAILGNEARDEQCLYAAFVSANDAVRGMASSNPQLEGMGTTMVAALETPSGLTLANVGDSRAYLFEDGRLRQLTEDQTWVQEVGRRLGLEEDKLKQHPMRHVLTMAIGVSDSPRIAVQTVQTTPGSLLLLSSDGLHGPVPEDVLCRILSGPGSLRDKCSAMIQAALDAGGPDNITVILVAF
jgi:protein phosphatase